MIRVPVPFDRGQGNDRLLCHRSAARSFQADRKTAVHILEKEQLIQQAFPLPRKALAANIPA